MSDELRWWYYGCDQRPEQHLWTPERVIVTDPQLVKLGQLSPLLAPQCASTPYVGVITKLRGWGITALSFWDYSVDRRAGSSSSFFVNDVDIPTKDFLVEVPTKFPWVFARFEVFFVNRGFHYVPPGYLALFLFRSLDVTNKNLGSDGLSALRGMGLLPYDDEDLATSDKIYKHPG